MPLFESTYIYICIIYIFQKPEKYILYIYIYVDSNNGIQITQKYYAKEIESTVDIHRKNTVNNKK